MTTNFRDFDLTYINNNGLIMYNIDQIIRQYYLQSHPDKVQSKTELRQEASNKFRNIFKSPSVLTIMKEVSQQLELKGFKNKFELSKFDTSKQENKIRSIAKDLNIFYYDDNSKDLFAVPVMIDYFLITVDKQYYNLVHDIMESIDKSNSLSDENEFSVCEMIEKLVPECNKELVEYYNSEIKIEKKKTINEINEYLKDMIYLDKESEFYENFKYELDNLLDEEDLKFKDLMSKLNQIEIEIDSL